MSSSGAVEHLEDSEEESSEDALLDAEFDQTCRTRKANTTWDRRKRCVEKMCSDISTKMGLTTTATLDFLAEKHPKQLFRWISENSRHGVSAQSQKGGTSLKPRGTTAKSSKTNAGAKVGLYKAYSTVESFRSAIAYHYDQIGKPIPKNVDKRTKDYMNGYNKKLGHARRDGTYKQDEGRAHMLFCEYFDMCSASFRMEKQRSPCTAIHLLLVLCWNLTSRIDTGVQATYNCISWNGDHLKIEIPTSKTASGYSKDGGEVENQLCCYANPNEALLVPTHMSCEITHMRVTGVSQLSIITCNQNVIMKKQLNRIKELEEENRLLKGQQQQQIVDTVHPLVQQQQQQIAQIADQISRLTTVVQQIQQGTESGQLSNNDNVGPSATTLSLNQANTFEWPTATDLVTLFKLWHLGNASENVGPYKNLDPRDCASYYFDEKSRRVLGKYFSAARGCMAALATWLLPMQPNEVLAAEPTASNDILNGALDKWAQSHE